MDERLKQQLDFTLEIDKEKNIFRQTHLSGHGRRENDAEHAWHMAIMAYLLREYANEPVDIAKVMLMCLIHDIVEIDAGDTYAYDPVGRQTQRQRETEAADRLFGLLPEDQCRRLRDLWEEFEAGQTPEAAFAHANDLVANLQEASVAMDRQEMSGEEAAQLLNGLGEQVSTVSLRLQQRFSAPRHQTVEGLIACFEDYASFLETLDAADSDATFSMKLKRQTLSTLNHLKGVYDALGNT